MLYANQPPPFPIAACNARQTVFFAHIDIFLSAQTSSPATGPFSPAQSGQINNRLTRTRKMEHTHTHTANEYIHSTSAHIVKCTAAYSCVCVRVRLVNKIIRKILVHVVGTTKTNAPLCCSVFASDLRALVCMHVCVC